MFDYFEEIETGLVICHFSFSVRFVFNELFMSLAKTSYLRNEREDVYQIKEKLVIFGS